MQNDNDGSLRNRVHQNGSAIATNASSSLYGSISDHGPAKATADTGSAHEHNPNAGETPHPKHKLGFIQSSAYLCGAVVGSGIFVSPTVIINQVHSIAFSLMFASVIFSFPGTVAIEGRTLGQYTVQAFQSWFCLSDERAKTMEVLIACLFIAALIILNTRPLHTYAARIQVVTSTLSIVLLVVIIVTGVVYIIIDDGYKNFDYPFNGTDYSASTLVQAIYGGLWSYAGWDGLVIIIEEIDKPSRTMPFATVTGMTSITLLYLLTNFAYFGVLGRDDMLNSKAVAETFFEHTFGKWASITVAVLINIVLIGCMNTTLLMGSRYIYAAGRNINLPLAMATVNVDTGIPTAAVYAMGFISLVLTCTSSIDSLINAMGVILWLPRVFSMMIIIYIRYKKLPVNENAIQMPIVLHVIFMVWATAISIVPCIFTPLVPLIGSSTLVASLIIYLVFFTFDLSRRLPWIRHFNEKSAILTQRLTMSMMAEQLDATQRHHDDQFEDNATLATEITRF